MLIVACPKSVYSVMASLLVTLLIGCGGGDDGPDAAEKNGGSESSAGALKVLVRADGTVEVDSGNVSAQNFAPILDREQPSEVWYFRESPNDEAAQDAGLAVLAEVESRRIPLVMYLDRDFEVPANSIE